MSQYFVLHRQNPQLRLIRRAAEIVRAVAVISRTGRSTRPATNHPSTAAPTVVTRSTIHEIVTRRARSALCCWTTTFCPGPAGGTGTVTTSPFGSLRWRLKVGEGTATLIEPPRDVSR